VAHQPVTGARAAAGPGTRPSRAEALVVRCADALDASATVPLLAQLTDGTVAGEVFARYLVVERDFVRTAARVAGWCLWQQPEWAVAEQHAAAVADLVGPQSAYFAALAARWPVDGDLDVVLDRAAALRQQVERALATGGYPAVVTSLLAAETLYLRWCTAAAETPADRPDDLQEWIDLHVTAGFRAQVAFLAEVVDTLPAPVTDDELDGWFRGMLTAEDAFHASPFAGSGSGAGAGETS
jgi:thiaminase/transcriptional activator TenA